MHMLNTSLHASLRLVESDAPETTLYLTSCTYRDQKHAWECGRGWKSKYLLSVKENPFNPTFIFHFNRHIERWQCMNTQVKFSCVFLYTIPIEFTPYVVATLSQHWVLPQHWWWMLVLNIVAVLPQHWYNNVETLPRH